MVNMSLIRSRVWLVICVLFVAHAAVGEQSKNALFALEDYFRLQRIVEVAMSPDGSWVAYATEQSSLQANHLLRQLYIQPVAGSGEAIRLDGFSDAHNMTWIEGSRELAFLSRRFGSSQVVSIDRVTRAVRQRTFSDHPVVAFAFSPAGSRLAYTSRSPTNPTQSLYYRMHNGESGIRVDPDIACLYDFTNPTFNSIDSDDSNPADLWLAADAADSKSIAVAGDVMEIHWSTDGRYLSVNYASNDVAPSLLRFYRTSVGVLDTRSMIFRTVVRAYETSGTDAWRSFAVKAWIPDSRKVLLLRMMEADPWLIDMYPQWSVAEMPKDHWVEEHLDWRQAEIYGAQFIPLRESKIVVGNVVLGTGSLFVWTPQGQIPAPLTANAVGSNSLFSFSQNGRDAAFVNESLNKPPEIFVKMAERDLRQLTHLNSAIASKTMPSVREITWLSADGVTVHGWLLEPSGVPVVRGRPLITFVHGGPTGPFPNMFAPYFKVWPYPFELLADSGIDVFIPNYRGSGTYGRAFGVPDSADGEPINDIVLGIKYLVDTGVADPRRLGLAGHSHGAWLGPLLMARHPLFRAASFAEGASNSLVLSELMSGRLNREVDAIENGGDFHDVPKRYLELSPDVQFQRVRAATLLESGSLSLAPLMLGFGKAALHFGIPSESFVYPRIGHNVDIPVLQKQSAQLNLDWFRFWLVGETDSDPAKAAQYVRWRELRTKHSTQSSPLPPETVAPLPGWQSDGAITNFNGHAQSHSPGRDSPAGPLPKPRLNVELRQ